MVLYTTSRVKTQPRAEQLLRLQSDHHNLFPAEAEIEFAEADACVSGLETTIRLRPREVRALLLDLLTRPAKS